MQFLVHQRDSQIIFPCATWYIQMFFKINLKTIFCGVSSIKVSDIAIYKNAAPNFIFLA